jgi:cytochrome b involved in lipid metabolism
MNEPDGYGSFFWWLSVVANYCQIESNELNKKQISNDQLMKHLQEQDNILANQDKVLEIQTSIYLKQILENQKKILSLLEGGKNAH